MVGSYRVIETNDQSRDIGAGSQFTIQLLGTLDYRATDWLTLRAGYRHLHIDYQGDVLRLNIAMSGPILGATFQF